MTVTHAFLSSNLTLATALGVRVNGTVYRTLEANVGLDNLNIGVKVNLAHLRAILFQNIGLSSRPRGLRGTAVTIAAALKLDSAVSAIRAATGTLGANIALSSSLDRLAKHFRQVPSFGWDTVNIGLASDLARVRRTIRALDSDLALQGAIKNLHLALRSFTGNMQLSSSVSFRRILSRSLTAALALSSKVRRIIRKVAMTMKIRLVVRPAS